ncbi:MAG TPA: 5-(carboxyamino)imidazole ribonucleotide synthase [Chloroflexi bacterium]|nr:5-(carboxyamino)imidazole ribonucleotide synthase [Chloroflexota bacterium]
MIRVGIIGGGQLGRMLALAGYPLGLRFRFLDPSPDAPVADLGELIVGAYDDPDALARFAEGLDVVTYEFENVPAHVARALERQVPVYPPPAALDVAQDRLSEKTFFNALGIPTPRYVAVDDRAGLDAAVAELGLPAVLKTRREGYDGKGQAILRDAADLDAAWQTLGGRPLILEAFVPYDRELAILAARGRDGSVAVWPVVEIEQVGGMLHRAFVPARRVDDILAATARGYVEIAMAELDYVGVLAIELFQVGDALLVNEMAPRVHNSGHWTIEGARTSQFENHLRAILGYPLGETDALGAIGLQNLIGEMPDPSAILAIPDAHLHHYGKAPRPGRKLGHITVRAADEVTRDERLAGVDAAACLASGRGSSSNLTR